MEGKMKNSKLLNHIFTIANDLREKNDSKTLNLFYVFAAALKFCEDVAKQRVSLAEFDEAETVKLFELLRGVLEKGEVSSTINQLCSKESSLIDELQFSRIMDASRKAAEEEGKSNISSDVVLRCIIDSAPPEIQALLSDGVAFKKEHKKESPEEFKAEPLRAFGAKPQEEFKAEPLREFGANPQEEFKSESLRAFGAEPEEEAGKGKSDDGTEKASEPIKPKDKIAEITEKVKQMQKKLSSVVFGQDNAISIFTSGYFQAELKEITDKEDKKPRATYLFAGPPGVGKTFLAEQISELLNLPFQRFDMSGYAERDALMELLGTNKSFKGDKEGGLTSFVANNPRCVLLFDEVEKAHIEVIHLFLQVLDAGRLRDTNSGNEVDFSKTIIIFTTNAGRKVYEDSLTSNLSGISRKTILKALENDVDPLTGKSSFPAAICSRFATGNVVMFNHMEAHILRKIAEKEINKSAANFEKETGIRCNVSDDVYSCVLFSEGGHADARTVKSRASSFFGTELYELFRLVSKKNGKEGIADIENININLDLPESEQALRLFRDDSKGSILSFGDPAVCSKLNSIAEEKGYTNVVATSFEEAKEIVNKQNIELIFCDLYSGRRSDKAIELNIEDVDSEGREFFNYVCESADMPLYIMSDADHQYSDEEQFSLIRQGARGVIDFSETDRLNEAVADILLQIHQQQSMIDLAKASKRVKFGTSQTISDDGKTAEIKIYGIALETTVDAEDSKSILSDVSKPDIKFSDVIGAENAKSELQYFVNYLKNPKEYSAKGLGVPKGVLFYGPPGTGKTMLAKAVAGESDVTFICAEGNQFLKKYVGEGEEAVHQLFTTARKYAPTIVFVDEIDAIAKERRGADNSADSILTAFLSEMDGFITDAKRPIFVLAATNFEVEPGTSKSLDQALLRRFDRHIFIDLPDKKARIEYIKMRIRNKPIFDISDTEIENIAVRSTGMSLANLASVFEFSMRIAVRENKGKVDDGVFEEAFESYNYGEEKKWDASELEKTAYHEAGHAFLCWHSGETPSYLTIVARGNHGGYMLHGDTENRGSYTKAMLLDRIRTALGGRASELVFFGDEDGLTTGASGDLRTATAIAKNMVCNYGMDDSMGMAVVNEGDLSSEAMAHQIREAVNRILNAELNRAKEILAENGVAIKKMVEELLDKNHLTSTEIDSIFSAYATAKN